MSYRLILSDKAKEDLELFKRTGQQLVVKKIAKLLKELKEHPYTGTGKPEPLKYELSGCWSRRITQEHRMTYKVIDDQVIVEVLAFKGHYI